MDNTLRIWQRRPAADPRSVMQSDKSRFQARMKSERDLKQH